MIQVPKHRIQQQQHGVSASNKNITIIKSSSSYMVVSIVCFRYYLIITGIILVYIHLYLLSIVQNDIQQHTMKQQQHRTYYTTTTTTTIPEHIRETNTNTKSSLNHDTSGVKATTTMTTTISTNPDAMFNNIPVYRIDSHQQPPKVTTVKCVSPLISSSTSTTTTATNHNNNHNNNNNNKDDISWMYRTCQYNNLCYDVTTRQYIAITEQQNNQNNQFPDVAIGGINPRWILNNHNVNEPYINVRQLQWKPNRYLVYNDTTTSNSIPFYYTMNPSLSTTTTFIPFHSMAGHNVGHLVWDDFYSIYMSLRIHYGNIDTVPPKLSNNDSHYNQFILLRHVIEHAATSTSKDTKTGSSTQSQSSSPQPLYATCDIRRNKRIACQQNFQRFIKLFGNTNNKVDPKTFFTTKTSQLYVLNQNSTSTTRGSSSTTTTTTTTTTTDASQPLSSVICFPKTIVGIGLLTDHGWYDHGWETSSSSPSSFVPHNLGRGRLFYDFTQFLLLSSTSKNDSIRVNNHNNNINIATTTTSSERWIPQITFSLESSRDWNRRLNFTYQIEALQKANSNNEKYKIKSYHMYELSLYEQIDIAQETNIYITTCGGGSMTTTFLQRNSIVILFYDPHGGYTYNSMNNTIQSNNLPSRLDWDLLNNISHLRIHWIPIQQMNTPIYIELFVRLIRHEVASLYRTPDLIEQNWKRKNRSKI